MKNQLTASTLLLFFLYTIPCLGQVTLDYSLSEDFEETQNLHTALVPLDNTNGENGYFENFLVPGTTCPDTFSVGGYYFYDNAGLQFENNQFVDCEYTVQFTFNLSDFSGPQGWVRLLNFTPNDDNGIYINLTNQPFNGTLDFWPNGTVGGTNFFNPTDLYLFVITRDCSGLVNIFINGDFFASYDDSGSQLYLVNPVDDVIVFFQDDPAVGNEASPGWVKNISISDFAISTMTIQEEWEDFCETLLEFDCSGVPNGASIIDDCGICLNPNDPNFNQSCADCAGIPNGTSIIDDCGICLDPNDPSFNQSCIDCAGIPNGTLIIDDCSVCLDPNDPNFNQSCTDCAGVLNGTSIIDDCGICLDPNDPDFNQLCVDCTGVPNGTSIIDDCGVCLDPNDPSFNQFCTDCAGILNGTSIIDDCGVCLDQNDPSFNQSCIDCAGVPNGTSIIDDCGECLEPDDPDFNESCAIEKLIYIPNAFSPNDDGFNDKFQIYKNQESTAVIKKYLIFNRWGTLMFEESNMDFNLDSNWWDGTFKGEKLDKGVYVYIVIVEYDNGGLIKYNGSITLVN